MKSALGLLLLLLLQEPALPFDPAVHEATKTFAHSDFLIVPVRVHRLRSTESDALNCRLKDEDVRRVFGKINRIWNKAGLGFAIESIRQETAPERRSSRGSPAAPSAWPPTAFP